MHTWAALLRLRRDRIWSQQPSSRRAEFISLASLLPALGVRKIRKARKKRKRGLATRVIANFDAPSNPLFSFSFLDFFAAPLLQQLFSSPRFNSANAETVGRQRQDAPIRMDVCVVRLVRDLRGLYGVSGGEWAWKAQITCCFSFKGLFLFLS